MNKKIALLASLCLLVMAVAVSAQDKTKSFAGDWELDVAKSELGERSRVESMTMNVTQTATEMTVDRKVKRAEREGNGGGGMGRGMRGGDGDQTFKYDLSGKETIAAMTGMRGGDVGLKAKSEKDGTMKLTQKRSFETPRGNMTIKTTETWKLSADGKTLTVSSEMETPRGNRNSKMVFIKK